MNNLFMSNMIRENRDNMSLNYILEEDKLFFETGYKVLQSQLKNGFIKCVKVSHNGKIKLIYDITKYKTLQTILYSLTPESFLTIIAKLLSVIVEVKNNGFMKCENIAVSFDKVFIDSNNLSVFLVYLPINTDTNANSMLTFERELKNSIIEAINRNQNLNTEAIGKLYADLHAGNYSIEMIMENIKSRGTTQENFYRQPQQHPHQQPQMQRPMMNNNIPAAQVPQQASNNVEKNTKNKEKGRSIFSVFTSPFGRKTKQTAQQSPQQAVVIFKPTIQGGATEILEDIFRPSIALCGLNTPVKVEIVINKPEFLLGKNVESVDGPLQFNKAISRVHCKIMFMGNQYYLADMGSVNGTFINGVRLTDGKQAPIKAGDRIKLANSEFIIKQI
jgi:hypothetical protein